MQIRLCNRAEGLARIFCDGDEVACAHGADILVDIGEKTDCTLEFVPQSPVPQSVLERCAGGAWLYPDHFAAAVTCTYRVTGCTPETELVVKNEGVWDSPRGRPVYYHVFTLFAHHAAAEITLCHVENEAKFMEAGRVVYKVRSLFYAASGIGLELLLDAAAAAVFMLFWPLERKRLEKCIAPETILEFMRANYKYNVFKEKELPAFY